MSLFGWIRDAVVVGTRPPPDASVDEIRRQGRRLFALGFVALVVGLGALALIFGNGRELARSSLGGKLGLVALFPGFTAVIVGGYRALGTGRLLRLGHPAALGMHVRAGLLAAGGPDGRR